MMCMHKGIRQGTGRDEGELSGRYKAKQLVPAARAGSLFMLDYLQVVHLTSRGTEDNFNADDFMGGAEEATSAAHAFLQAVITFRNCCVEQFGG